MRAGREARPGLDVLTLGLLTALSRGGVLLLCLAGFGHSDLVAHLVADLSTWQDFFHKVQHGLVPYVDFTKEYPAGAGLFYWALSPLVGAGDLKRILVVHGLAMTLADLVNAWLAYRIFAAEDPRRALPMALLFTLNLTALVLSPFRFEGVVVTFVLLGYECHRRGRPLWAAAFWSFGACLKWFPVFFIAAQEWRALRVEGRRFQWAWTGLVSLGVAAAVNAPFLLADLRLHGHLDHWLGPYLFHVGRPLYWDTLLGVGELWCGALSFERFGSLWSLGLVLAALFVRPGMALARRCVLLCVAALLANRVYSTQFHLWFYPFLILVALREPSVAGGRRFLRLFVGLDLLNVLVYPFSFSLAYAEIGGFSPSRAWQEGGVWAVVFSLAIVLRAALLAALALRLLGPEGGGGRAGAEAALSPR